MNEEFWKKNDEKVGSPIKTEKIKRVVEVKPKPKPTPKQNGCK